jgi:hypothetical protein
VSREFKSKEDSIKKVQEIVERQQKIENGQFGRLVISAEGMSCNNTALAPFKRGAFEACLPVIPMILRYQGSLIKPVTGYLHIAEGAIFLICCNWWNACQRYEMPTFIPNDYLFETHKDKGRNKAEIFAWAVRDAMSKTSGLPCSDATTMDLKSEMADTVKGKKTKKE